MTEQALRRTYHLAPERYRIGPGSHLAEIPPPCPGGHTYRPGDVIVGWLPCPCEANSNGGHRSYHCADCTLVQHVPGCVSTDRTTTEHALRF